MFGNRKLSDGARSSEYGRRSRVCEAIGMHNSHCDERITDRRIVLMGQYTFCQFSGLYSLTCFSQLLQQIGTIFPVYSSAFLKVIHEHMPFASQKTDAITFAAEETTFAFAFFFFFLGGGGGGGG